MPLIFRYGPMNVAKTAHLLMEAFAYRSTKKQAIIVKLSVDTRSGLDKVWSRVPNLENKADITLNTTQLLSDKLLLNNDDNGGCIFIDEAQFLDPKQAYDIVRLSMNRRVVCYGLLTDYTGQLFAASSVLIAMADEKQEIKGICEYCTHESLFSHKLEYTEELDKYQTVIIGAADKYAGVCKQCFLKLNEHRFDHLKIQ